MLHTFQCMSIDNNLVCVLNSFTFDDIILSYVYSHNNQLTNQLIAIQTLLIELAVEFAGWMCGLLCNFLYFYWAYIYTKLQLCNTLLTVTSNKIVCRYIAIILVCMIPILQIFTYFLAWHVAIDNSIQCNNASYQKIKLAMQSNQSVKHQNQLVSYFRASWYVTWSQHACTNHTSSPQAFFLSSGLLCSKVYLLCF